MSGDPARPIVVVGSINMDLVMRIDRLPAPGETRPARSLATLPGGKGANQAVAIARLGGAVAMVGRLGDDPFGATLRAGLEESGVATAGVATTPGASGVAVIQVDDAGENAISLVAGANGLVTPADVRRHAATIAGASALVVQLEVPPESVAEAIGIATGAGVRTVLDPAPAPAGMLGPRLAGVDVLSPNQTEAAALAGVPVETPADAARAARVLQAQGARNVVVKLGARGATWLDADGREGHVPAFAVAPVDTTAAGDAFTGALALGLVRGATLPEAVRFACAAGALATTKAGAQPAMPDREAVTRLLETQP
jgi:ribokinase